MIDGIAFARWVSTVASQLSASGRARTVHIEETITALREAYYMTFGYEEEVETGGSRSRQEELRIALAWEKFAVKVRRYDEGLFNRLRLKGRYWREGGEWSAEMRHNAKIGLDRIRQDAEVQLIVRQRVPRP